MSAIFLSRVAVAGFRESVLRQFRVHVAGLLRMREDAERIHNAAVVADIDSKLAVYDTVASTVEEAALDAEGIRRTNIMGYFDDPKQTTPAFDPGLDVACPICLGTLSTPLVTISLMVPGDDRSFFYRAHRACWDSTTSEEQSHLEGTLVDARAALVARRGAHD